MTEKRLLDILIDYINYDCETCNLGDVKNKLESVATKEEIAELGYGWLYPEEY